MSRLHFDSPLPDVASGSVPIEGPSGVVHRMHEIKDDRFFVSPDCDGTEEMTFCWHFVYEYLLEFSFHALGIIHFKASMALHPEEEMSQARAELMGARLNHAKWIRNSIGKLEDLMKPYMSFERL